LRTGIYDHTFADVENSIRPRPVMRTLLFFVLFGTSLLSGAVDLRLRGEVTTYGTNAQLGDVLVRVYRNGIKEQAFTTGQGGKYTVDLERGGNYVIRFSRPGHITKCFAVDTKGEAWQGDTREVSVSVEMMLFKKVPGMDLSFFDLPMGLARFEPLTGFLSWDKAYEERIRPEVDRLMTELRRRSEDELDPASVVEEKGSSRSRSLGHRGMAIGKR